MKKDLFIFLKTYKLFSSLSEKAILKIASKFIQVDLEKGETLFKQGDPAENVYILSSGKLTASILTADNELKRVGHIKTGDTVGELSALSNEPRALTVKALQNSVLYKISNKNFIEICRHYPKVMFESIHPVIARSQNIIHLLSLNKENHTIILIAANESIPLEKFLAKFSKYTKRYNSINLISDLMPEFKKIPLKTLTMQVAQLIKSQKTKKNIFVLQSLNSRLAKLCVKKSKKIYIIADSSAEPKIDEGIINFIHSGSSKLNSNPELILLHAEYFIVPQNTATWLSLVEFKMYYNISINKGRHYRRLLRFILGKAIGLVLGGGGTRGWAHLGVLKALQEKKAPIDFIGGASVGAIIAACFAINESYKDAMEKSSKIFTAAHGSVSLFSLTWPFISLFDAKRFTNSLIDAFSGLSIEELWLPYFCISSNMANFVEEVHRTGLVWEKTRASASIPGLIPPMVIQGELHLDGGLLNNLPVDIMQQFVGPRGKVIAIELNSSLHDYRKYSFPPILTFKNLLLTKFRFNSEKYKFPRFIDTFLRGLLIGSSAKTKVNRLTAKILIDLNLDKFRLLNTNKKQNEKMFEIGYEKTIQLLLQRKKKNKPLP